VSPAPPPFFIFLFAVAALFYVSRASGCCLLFLISARAIHDGLLISCDAVNQLIKTIVF
jgi:hypothetical protein